MQFQDVWFAIFATSFTVALSHKQVTPHVLIHLVFCRWPVARAGSACQWMKLQMEPITGAKQPAEPLQPSNMLRGSSSLRDSAWICTAKRCFAAIRFVESQGVDIWWYMTINCIRTNGGRKVRLIIPSPNAKVAFSLSSSEVGRETLGASQTTCFPQYLRACASTQSFAKNTLIDDFDWFCALTP